MFLSYGFIWRFPEKGIPHLSPTYRWNFHEINHPAGDAPIKMETSILWMVAKSGYHQLIGGKHQKKYPMIYRVH